MEHTLTGMKSKLPFVVRVEIGSKNATKNSKKLIVGFGM
jgi:hypothetical protein